MKWSKGFSLQNVAGQQLLHFVNVYRLIEFVAKAGLVLAGDPDFKLCIEVEGAGRFDAEAGNAFITHREVTGFSSGNSLLINQNETPIGENKGIANQLKADFDFFFLEEEALIFFA